MGYLRQLIDRFRRRFRKHFEENRETRIQDALLASFLALLAWTAGVLAGSVAAYFVVSFTPDSSGRDWPALYVLIGVTLLVGVPCTIRAWQMYQRKVSDS